MNSIKLEIAIGLFVLLISFFLFGRFDVLEQIVEWSSKHEQYELDEFISTAVVMVFVLLIFSVRRGLETMKKAKQLQKALDEIEVLKGIIPICSYCKKIRDDQGMWNQLEAYIRSHSSAEFSHGICPECMKEHMGELEELE